MKRTLLIIFAALSIMAFGSAEAKTSKSAKAKTTTTKKSTASKYSFVKTSDGFVSPEGHTYQAKDGPVCITLDFQDEDTLYFVFQDGSRVTKRYFEWSQNKNSLVFYGDETMRATIAKDGMKMTSDGIVFSIIK